MERIASSGYETPEGDRSPGALITVIDPFTLRLKDINRELGYRTGAPAAVAAERHSQLIVTNLAVCSMLGGLKAVELFLIDSHSADVAWPSAMSSEIVSIFASLAALYLCKRVSPRRSRRVIWALILAVNGGLTAYFFVDPSNPLMQVLHDHPHGCAPVGMPVVVSAQPLLLALQDTSATRQHAARGAGCSHDHGVRH